MKSVMGLNFAFETDLILGVQYWCWSRRDFNETRNRNNPIYAPDFSIKDDQVLQSFSTSFEFNETHARCHYKQDEEWEQTWFDPAYDVPCSTSTLPVAIFQWRLTGLPRYVHLPVI